MKFTNIYQETEENLRLALLSFWAPGKNPMRRALNDLFDREPLVAEPVFQSTFGWETVKDDAWKSYLNPSIISKLKIGFDKKGNPQPPFTHQESSWKALKEGKSIVVTSGTGSGKTECFMYPVISDLYEQRGNNAIQAIFLYPLNALMEDQKNRLNDYCQAAGLKYAVYNGNTPEYKPLNDKKSEEVGTREEIRDKKGLGTRPQILLTNPSMLEYILVRQRDQIMLEQSAGKLRWIVIDEAHSYSGSAAVELAFQIKRILEAFNVSPNDVRFACTSATIGGADGAKSLLEFISNVIGQDQSQIEIIGGTRIVPDINTEVLQSAINDSGLSVNADKVLELRDEINKKAGIDLLSIWQKLCPDKKYDVVDALKLVDALCELSVGGKPVLSLRGHFFMRSISGIYACASKDCAAKEGTQYGHLTTYKSSVCPICNGPLLELVQCKRCGEFILMGETDREDKVQPCVEGVNHDDYFALDEDIDEQNMSEEHNEASSKQDTFFAIPYDREHYFNPLSSAHAEVFNLVRRANSTYMDRNVGKDGSWVDLRKDARHAYCPKCGKLAQGKRMNFKYFRVPINFINQTISPVFLSESCPPQQAWGKYIAFTDSRQGTAISAKTFNIEVERRICRQRLVEELAKKAEMPIIPGVDISTLDPVVVNALLAKVGPRGISLFDLSNRIFNEKIFEHITDGKFNSDEKRAYKDALMRNFIGTRRMYEKVVENMGLATLVYPKLANMIRPNSLIDLSDDLGVDIEDSDWRDFLKIALDYFMRQQNHIQPLRDHEKMYVRDSNISTPVKKENWPSVNRNNNDEPSLRQPRLVVLLCAALGIDNHDKLKRYWRSIDSILIDAWNALTDSKILTEVTPYVENGYSLPKLDGKYIGCYYLDLSDEEDNDVCFIKRPETAWVCPVTGNVLDTTFCGFSPMMIGEVSRGLFEMYKCGNKINLPKRPKDVDDLDKWLEENIELKQFKEAGLWSDRHKYIYYPLTAYLAAEHSAQQSKDLLKQYVEKFSSKTPSINVLHCSTTMEMGVDIGDIDIVLMDTVPPSPANYLQRVGRAGRMGQTKSIAFSLCNNTPVGQHAFSHPMWALETITHMKPVLQSGTITQRHANSYFFRQFICAQGSGMAITTIVDEFMDDPNSICDEFLAYLDRMSTYQAARNKFDSIFNGEMPFECIRVTYDEMLAIRDNYRESINKLKEFYDKHNGNEARQHAIAKQIEKEKNGNLLKYLSEHQFLPNASMPTGVVTFDFMDRSQTVYLMKLRNDRKRLVERIKAEEDESVKNLLRSELHEVQSKIEGLYRATESSRDSYMALNEYAPEQTVVVNEKNYVSAGVKLYGEYGDDTKLRYIYFCRHCGHVVYDSLFDENRRCEKCGEPYRAIIGNVRTGTFTRAYEPVGFRTDQNVEITREESTDKQFYEIKPLLTDIDWSNATELNLCQMVGSSEKARILFYNAGNKNGFAFCKCCGRAAVESANYTEEIPVAVRPGHKKLEIGNTDNICEATAEQIARNVVFTASHYTCYTVLRFKKGIEDDTFVTDESLVYSLGVILKRALVSYLGIDESEIDFGYKEELGSIALFIYDVARGGCGYSLHLANEAELAEVFNIARNLLYSYDCSCEDNGGACSRCLVDRNNYRYSHLLSKGKVMEWLRLQSMREAAVPSTVQAFSPEAKILYQTPKGYLKDTLINSGDVKSISLYVSDDAGECVINDWLSSKSDMGRTIRQVIDYGKEVNIYVEYHPDIHSSYEDKYPFATLSIPDAKVQLINELGNIKPIIEVEYRDGRFDRFFVTDKEALVFSNDWGANDATLYYDHTKSVPVVTDKPSLEDTSVIIREGSITRTEPVTVGRYFQDVISPVTMRKSDLDKLISILSGKVVDIHFSDSYLNCALASMMLVYLVKELKGMFGFTIANFTLQIDSYKRKCVNRNFSDYSLISHNWPSEEDADQYTILLIEDELGVTPVKSQEDALHHRFLKLTNKDGGSVEIRFDHGVAGGWSSRSKYMNVYGLGETTQATSDGGDILYYLIIKE